MRTRRRGSADSRSTDGRSTDGRSKKGHSTAEGLPLDRFLGEGYRPEDGPAGLLYSQVGYEPSLPVRVVVRLPKRTLLGGEATMRLTQGDGRKQTTPCPYWGERWGSHWWVAEFEAGLDEGLYELTLLDGRRPVFASRGLEVKRNVLWDRTVELATVDNLERRRKFSKCPAGWQDAGTLWVESCSQSAMVIALCELLEEPGDRLSPEMKQRILEQITVGSDYLVLTQEKARSWATRRGP
ncbi:MAG: hypothetical protein R2751_15950 [Bacteroidales bacterium]